MTETKTAQPVRKQFQVTEHTLQKELQAWNDLVVTTIELTFDTADKSLRYRQEAAAQATRVLQDAFATYHGLTLDGLKLWRDYVQSLTAIVNSTS